MITIMLMFMLMFMLIFMLMFMLTMFRFPKVMFSGFAALLWTAAILCFLARRTQNSGEGYEMVKVEVLTKQSICRLTTTSGPGLLSWW